MTFLEKLEEDGYDFKERTVKSGLRGCPADYGYEKPFDCDLDCGYCWTREVKKDVDGIA